MKYTWKLLTLILVLGIYSCQEEDSPLSIGDTNEISDIETTESLLTAETSAESLFEDVDLTIDESFEFAFSTNNSSSGRASFERRRAWNSKHFGDCVEVDHDTVEQVIIIDFGDGCEGRNGVIRSGKIIITYDGNRNTVGSFKSITFEDFFIGGTQVEGIKTHTILAIDENGNKTVQNKLEGGKLTFEDGSTVTRDHELTRFKFKGESIEESYSTLDGFASGKNKEDMEYSMNIDESLLFQGSCFGEGYGFLPVSGIKTITKGEEEWIVDFGDGECDNLVTVTHGDEVQVIELTRRGRKVVRG